MYFHTYVVSPNKKGLKIKRGVFLYSDARSSIKKPSFAYALFMLLVVIGIISVGILVFDAPIQMLMLISMFALIPLMIGLGFNYKQVEKSMIRSM